MRVSKLAYLFATVSILVIAGNAQAIRKKTNKMPLATTQAKIVTDKSTIKWVGKKKLVNSEHHGEIKLKEGSLHFKGDQLVGGMFVADMTTITNKDLDGKSHEKLVGHLKSDDFFAVDKFGTATFKITKAKKTGKDQYEVTGTMTIKGKTNEEKFVATIKEEKDGTWKGTGTLTFDRTKYDVRYGSDNFFDNLGDKVISNDVKLMLELTAAKGA